MLVGALVGAAFAVHAAPSEAACVATLNWHGYAYMGHGNVPGAHTGDPIPLPAKAPSCNDTSVNGAPPPATTWSDLSVTRIKGIEPSIAVASSNVVYINQSTFPALPSHPFHKALGQVTWPTIVGQSCQVRGVAKTDASGLYVNGARIFVEKDTKVELQRHGTGFVPPGTEIRVGGKACERKYGELWIKARRIAHA